MGLVNTYLTQVALDLPFSHRVREANHPRRSVSTNTSFTHTSLGQRETHITRLLQEVYVSVWTDRMGVSLIACPYTLHLTTTFTSSHVDPYACATTDCRVVKRWSKLLEIWSSHRQGQRRFVSLSVGEHCDKMATGLARTCVSVLTVNLNLNYLWFVTPCPRKLQSLLVDLTSRIVWCVSCNTVGFISAIAFFVNWWYMMLKKKNIY